MGASLPRDGLLKEQLAYTMMAIMSDNGENVKRAEAFLEGMLEYELSTTTSPGMVFRTDTNATRFVVAYISYLCRTNGVGGFFHEVMDEAVNEVTAISSTDDIDIDRKHLLSSSSNELVDEEVINNVLEENAIRWRGYRRCSKQGFAVCSQMHWCSSWDIRTDCENGQVEIPWI